MNSALLLVSGIGLIWIVATGRASAVLAALMDPTAADGVPDTAPSSPGDGSGGGRGGGGGSGGFDAPARNRLDFGRGL